MKEHLRFKKLLCFDFSIFPKPGMTQQFSLNFILWSKAFTVQNYVVPLWKALISPLGPGWFSLVWLGWVDAFRRKKSGYP